ncbi:MAG: helix-turn-helix domain-containing protein, partial [Planctomycetota bacterium]|nr:helix-turn-helix domain-containing protein [Planctomycetota bacterium]
RAGSGALPSAPPAVAAAEAQTGSDRRVGRDLKDVVRAAVETVERDAILKVLQQTGWKKSEAARVLGISRPTLDAKIEAYGLEKKV